MNLSHFLDASFLIALAVEDDQYHPLARDHWQSRVASRVEVLTTDYILCEVIAFLQSRGHHAKAVLVGDLVQSGEEIRMIHVEGATLATAWQYFVRHNDKSYSLADCVSFTLMREEGIREALTFDHHFSQAGFRMLPGP